MKKIHIQKQVKKTSLRNILINDSIEYAGGRWEIVTMNIGETPTLILRRKMSKVVRIFTVSENNRVGVVEISPEKVHVSSFASAENEITFSAGRFKINDNSTETSWVPAKIDDTFKYGYNEYSIKFIADDGSLMVWDDKKSRSIFVNRNDRDQLRAYGMELR